MSNPLTARRTAPTYETVDKHYRCAELNSSNLTYLSGWFYFVKEIQSPNGQLIESIERMDLPSGTKAWLRDNERRVFGLIKSIVGDDIRLIDEVYRRAIASACSPISWFNLPRE